LDGPSRDIVLDQIIASNGAVVLFGDRRIATPGADWPSLLHKLGRQTMGSAGRRIEACVRFGNGAKIVAAVSSAGR